MPVFWTITGPARVMTVRISAVSQSTTSGGAIVDDRWATSRFQSVGCEGEDHILASLQYRARCERPQHAGKHPHARKMPCSLLKHTLSPGRNQATSGGVTFRGLRPLCRFCFSPRSGRKHRNSQQHHKSISTIPPERGVPYLW